LVRKGVQPNLRPRVTIRTIRSKTCTTPTRRRKEPKRCRTKSRSRSALRSSSLQPPPPRAPPVLVHRPQMTRSLPSATSSPRCYKPEAAARARTANISISATVRLGRPSPPRAARPRESSCQRSTGLTCRCHDDLRCLRPKRPSPRQTLREGPTRAVSGGLAVSNRWHYCASCRKRIGMTGGLSASSRGGRERRRFQEAQSSRSARLEGWAAPWFETPRTEAAESG
jgi:hypothetical protein